MIVLLDGLAGSFCQRFPCISFHWSPTWLLCWMPWPDHLATGLFSFLFICPAHDCFAGCLGRIILPKGFPSFLYHLSPTWLLLLDALAGVFCHRFACISFHLPPTYLLCWMPWPDHVATGLFSFLFICPAHDCFAGCLGRIILPKVPFMSVHVSLTWCIAGWLGRIVLPRVSLISRHWSPR